MSSMNVIVAGILLIVAVEFFLWELFWRKVLNLRFPRQADESFFAFFTMVRLRVFALFHSLFLIAVLLLSVLFLW